ncbi:MAG: hypothetical protein ACE5WD_04040 [Candidatus Aminicenantia bacterium]
MKFILIIKKFISLSGVLWLLISSISCAIWVRRPPPPPSIVEIRPPKPHPRAIWIPGHWKWNSRYHKYIWVPGHWRIK